MTFRITDDSGFLAIIDPDAYHGFVHADWTTELLREHLAREMATRHLLIWGTGLENFWKIKVSIQRTGTTGFREITGGIIASQGRLLLTNYESLTMAAQFPGVCLPQAHEWGDVLSVPPGIYNCRILQLSDPEGDGPFEEPVNFVYEVTPAAQAAESWREIPWESN